MHSGLQALADWVHGDRRHLPPPASVKLWRLRSPTGAEIECTAHALLDVGLELRLLRDGEIYMTKVMKAAETAHVQQDIWKAALESKGWTA